MAIFFLVLAIIGAAVGGLQLLMTVASAETEPQQAAGAASAD